MSMCSYVKGIVEPDEKWDRMKAVYISCDDAEVDIPDEVINYFDGNDPREMEGLEVEIKDAVIESSDDGRDHFTVDLSKIPSKVKKIRFTNSW